MWKDLESLLTFLQMEPSSRPTFVETAKHLEYILIGSKPRPDIDKAMDTTSPQTPQRICLPSNECEHEYNPEKDNIGAVKDIKTSPNLFPPAIIVSTDASPMMVRSAEKRRQSWISGRYKLFNTATDDLLKTTPGKLKSFFHRVLRVQTHFDPSKQKKGKTSGKQRSASHLKSYSVINSQDDGTVVTFVENHEKADASNPSSPNSHASRFLRRESLERDLPSDLGSEEDSVDGNISPRSLHSESAHSLMSPSTLGRPQSPNMLSPSSWHPSECDTPVSKLLDESNRPRCQSTPVCNDVNPGSLSRRTASHRECKINNADHSTPDVQLDEMGKIKTRKSPFWFLKRRTSKCKDSE